MSWPRAVADLLVPGIGTVIVRLELTALAAACIFAWIRRSLAPVCSRRLSAAFCAWPRDVGWRS